MDHACHRRRHTVCPHPHVRILHRPRVASRIASARVDARDDAMRAMRCVRARFAPIRDIHRARAASTGTPTVARRPRVDRDDAVAVPTARWIRGDADGRRRRDVDDARRRGRDSKIRRLALIRRARASGATRLYGDARRRIRRAREGRADARETRRGRDAAMGRPRRKRTTARVRRERPGRDVATPTRRAWRAERRAAWG